LRLISLVDFFLPPLARSDPRKAQPARLLVAACLVVAAFEPIMSLRHFVLAHNAGAGGLTLGAAGLAVVLLAALRCGLPARIALDIVITLVLVASTVVSLARGGFYISTLISVTLIPLITGLIGLRRATFVWTSIAGLVLLTLAVVTHLGFMGLRRETAVDAGPLLVFLLLTTVVSVVYQHTRQDLELQAKELQRRIEVTQRLEALGSLAAGVAHDFNNLLTIFAAAGEAMVEDLPADHPLRPDADAVCEAAARGATIARQLLVFSHPQTRAHEAFELGASVRAMEPLLRRALPETIALGIESSSTALRVLGDPGQLTNVILNLVVNARDAMPTGGSVRITLAKRVAAGSGSLGPGRYVAIQVRDDGAGIAPDVLPHIFEPFFTTKTRERGSGLGLASAYGTVRAMNGEIGVETVLGHGSTFEILLPLLDDVVVVPQAVVPELPQLPARRQTVLVVDDQPELVAAARRLLGREFDVLTAIGAEDALAMFAARPDVDVVVTDVCMPSIGGVELATRLRRLKPSIGVVYMTGYSDDAAITRELAEGTAGIIHKPFDRAGLRTEILAACARGIILEECAPLPPLSSRGLSSSSAAAR
jgi:signal transduction histidine kinase/ActR/RegA family two-component response regulator